MEKEEKLSITYLSKHLNVEKSEIEYVKTFESDSSSKASLLKCKDEKYVVHLFEKDEIKMRMSGGIPIDEINVDNLEKPLYINEKYSICKYMEGVVLSSISYHPYFKKIAESIHLLHDIGKMGDKDFDPFSYMGNISKMIKESYDHLFVKSVSILNDNKKLLEGRKKTLCHNHLEPSKMILRDDEPVYFLDSSCIMNNDFAFDIACFGKMDFNDSIKLLEIYKKNYTSEDLLALKLWRIYLNCLEYLINLRRHELKLDKHKDTSYLDIALFNLNHNIKIINSL